MLSLETNPGFKKHPRLGWLCLLFLFLYVCSAPRAEQTAAAPADTSYAAVTEILAELNRLQTRMAELRTRHARFRHALQSVVPRRHENGETELSLHRINKAGNSTELKGIIDNARRQREEQQEENHRLRAELEKTARWLQQVEDEFQNLAAQRQELLLRLEKALRGDLKNAEVPKQH